MGAWIPSTEEAAIEYLSKGCSNKHKPEDKYRRKNGTVGCRGCQAEQQRRYLEKKATDSAAVPHGKRNYKLSCGHTFVTTIPPTKGDTLWCGKCDDYSGYQKVDIYGECEHQHFACRTVAELYRRIKAHAMKHGVHEFTLRLPGGVRKYVPNLEGKK
jgi:hypothetical protein